MSIKVSRTKGMPLDLGGKDVTPAIGLANEFTAWYEALTPRDRTNFDALLQLPNALDLLAKCPDKKYGEMGTFALGARGLLKVKGAV